MQQKKLFTKGIDSDTASEFIEDGRDRFRNNVRVLSSDTGNVGSVETVNGNSIILNNNFPFFLISFTPQGDNTVIGSFEYQLTQKIYYFVHNTLDNHSIVEYDQVAETFAIVFTSSILNFKLEALITGINVIELDKDNHLLYWTDGWINPNNPDEFNQPKKINIEKGKYFMAGDYVNGYKFPFDPEILYRIKRPPAKPPGYYWGGLDGDGFEFKASNNFALSSAQVFFDNAYYNPDSEYNPANGSWTVLAPGNYSVHAEVLVEKYAGSPLPAIVDIEIRVNGSTAYSSTATKTNYPITVTANPSLILLAGDVVTVWIFPVTALGDVIYGFGVSYTALKNAITATDINHLFKRLFTFKIQFVYDDNEKSAWSPISDYKFPKTTGSKPTGEDIVLQDNKITINVPTGSSIVTKIRIASKQLPSTDFSLIAELNKADLQLPDNSVYQYEFTNEVNGVPLEINESIKLFDTVPLTSGAQEFIKGIRIVDGNITENYNPVPIDLRLSLSYGIVDSNDNSFFPARLYEKSGSLKEWGVVYYDYFNRSGTTNVVKGKSDVLLQNGTYGTSLYIPFLTEDSYNPAFPDGRMDYVPQITANIYNRPPVWATHYQIVSSKNQIMGRYIQFTAQDVQFIDDEGIPTTRAAATRLEVNISNIIGIYKTENPLSTLVYDFIKGDRIRFIAAPATTSSPTIFDTITPFLPFNDTAIDSFSPSTQKLYVPINDNNILRDPIIDRGVLFEIYSPAVPVINEGELIYEIGECYDIATLPSGEKAHLGGQGVPDQSYFTFDDNIFQAPGFAGFIGSEMSGFSIGDKIKVAQNPGFVNASYNTYATVTGIVPSGSNEIVVTDIPWGINSAINGGVITRAATVVLSGGDCFRRFCNMPHLSGVTRYRLYSYIETMSASNMFTSNAWDYGRPNRIDDNIKRTSRPSTICYSNIFVPETFINGLSSTSDFNFQTYDNPYGSISKLDTDGQRLIMCQELKNASIPIEQSIVETTQGEDILAAVEKVLSPTPIYYTENYGIGKHPSSYAKYANAKYGIDVKRGVVWRLSNDGITPISEYYQHIYFTDLCKKIMLSSTPVKIYGVFDIRFGEYIISVEGFTYTGIYVPPQTIAFNEKSNEWSTHYSIFPENMVGNGVNVIAFKNGQLWKQNSNPIQNNFFGVQYASEVHSVCNANPSNVKILEAISEECNDVWEAPEITTENGQKTNLIEEDFQEKENMQYAALWRDENTVNVPTPLIEGDVMRDTTFLAKLKYSKTAYNKMFAVNFQYIISNLHNNSK